MASTCQYWREVILQHTRLLLVADPVELRSNAKLVYLISEALELQERP